MSEINKRVLCKLLLKNIAPSKLSIPSAIFLPVQLKNSSLLMDVVENGGSHFLESGSFMRMYSLSFRFYPNLNKPRFVMKLFFISFIFFSFDPGYFSK